MTDQAGATAPEGATAHLGEVLVKQPGEAISYWQPVPANGHIDVIFSPDMVPMEFPIGFGTQTVPPGGYVREHAHDRNEEVIFVIRGKGRAVVEGVSHAMQPGSAFFIGRNRRHMFINEGTEDILWTWLIVPNGLEDFFRLIGRPRQPGEPAPEPFPRPENVLQIERDTVFAAPPSDPRQP
ncbi:cupin domain-containing protein [Ancylobacter dichloromethanicus]|uniref:Cupin n=2 Tax=Ancylobacter dichloromethanicus TaxID=518825 RepID=A0A9W6J7A9_9HYPH|nr:cupin domain-containing protein [Ancylobacter dichloromethanicus]MBS7552786.1 cupin domain-containing protein [Ancylobacter dichloromethanicus]GLK72150.1 cupin [Ancylobacter dichloromethanicus]